MAGRDAMWDKSRVQQLIKPIIGVRYGREGQVAWMLELIKSDMTDGRTVRMSMPSQKLQLNLLVIYLFMRAAGAPSARSGG